MTPRSQRHFPSHHLHSPLRASPADSPSCASPTVCAQRRLKLPQPAEPHQPSSRRLSCHLGIALRHQRFLLEALNLLGLLRASSLQFACGLTSRAALPLLFSRAPWPAAGVAACWLCPAGFGSLQALCLAQLRAPQKAAVPQYASWPEMFLYFQRGPGRLALQTPGRSRLTGMPLLASPPIPAEKQSLHAPPSPAHPQSPSSSPVPQTASSRWRLSRTAPLALSEQRSVAPPAFCCEGRAP
mmetsp:Transcript_140991/g.262996  ORF Transcript_140991/g.262996 Transcript_140991/m.262996 type:complete len:241 (-) Transcript_140991:1254-1976(-)